MRSTPNPLVMALVLFALTLLVVGIDRSARAKRRANLQFDDPLTLAVDPGFGTMIALTILVDIAALPYWFWSTRKSLLGLVLGVVAFIACFGASLAVAIVAA